jgi:hypothetical protein
MGGPNQLHNTTTSSCVRDDASMDCSLTDEAIGPVYAVGRGAWNWTTNNEWLVIECLVSNHMRLKEQEATAKCGTSESKC